MNWQMLWLLALLRTRMICRLALIVVRSPRAGDCRAPIFSGKRRSDYASWSKKSGKLILDDNGCKILLDAYKATTFEEMVAFMKILFTTKSTYTIFFSFS